MVCGVTGIVLREGVADAARVRAMCDRIRHRGPDDEGVYAKGRCSIGMRRLSIIDLDTGHQPIANEDGSLWIVFNGEIYNYQALRAELVARGHVFRTCSDTETVIHLFEEEGPAGLSRLRGMFAFAIWDERKQSLFLARDRFGKKPLYYAASPHSLLFGSEMKCLRQAGAPLEIDSEALQLYFYLGYIPDPYSAFRAVRKLPAGSWLSYDAPAGRWRVERYWRPPEQSPEGAPGVSEPERRERLLATFDEAVRVRMIADVPLGAFLSGGIDSSCVVASMALQSRDPVKTFSIGFEERRFNELEYAAAVARKYRTDHHEIVVRPDSVALVQRLIRHFGEPFADSSAIPTFIVSEFAARHVKVALSGDGGDEIFTGYERFAHVEKLRWMDRIPTPLRSLIGLVGRWAPYSAYGKNYLRLLSCEPGLPRYLEANFAPYVLRQRLLRPQWMAPADAAFLAKTFADYLLPSGADLLSQAICFELMVNLPGFMLVKTDRMSMANSLEVRCPLLDPEVAEFASTIPHSWRIRNGRGKAFLIETMQDRLPPELWNRPKMGFAIPLADWFRTSLRGMLWDHLTSRRFLDRGYVSPEFLTVLLEEHDRGRRNNASWLWTLLMLELWHEELEDDASLPRAAADH